MGVKRPLRGLGWGGRGIPGLPSVALGYGWVARVGGLQGPEMWAKIRALPWALPCRPLGAAECTYNPGAHSLGEARIIVLERLAAGAGIFVEGEDLARRRAVAVDGGALAAELPGELVDVADVGWGGGLR